MQVKLIGNTSDALGVLYKAARQCYKPGFVGDMDVSLVDKDDMIKLINYIISSGHHSVLEHVSFTFAIEGISRACSHQLVRHRMGSYSQQSQRYCDMSNGDFVIPKSIQENVEALEEFKLTIEDIQNCYSKLQKLGISNEDARFILPNATTTNIIVSMNCRALFNFFNERLCKCAQWEIRDLAKEMKRICVTHLPEVFVTKNAGPKCDVFGFCPEDPKRSCGKYLTKD